jgi:hypothetical protein
MRTVPFIHIFLMGLAVILQGAVAYYSWKLYRMIKPLQYWTKAWFVYFIGMLIVIIRRMWGIFAWAFGCYTNGWVGIVESLILLVVSFTWLFFIYELKQLFGKYLGPIGKGEER